MSSSNPIVAVVGATGQQGGSVIRALLKTRNYRIRGLTRDVNSSSSKALTVQGVEMVSADMNDRKSLENAFHGAEIVFAVTNFWDPANIAAYVKDDAKSDLHQGKNMADAAKAVGVKRYVWSTLPPSLEISGGKCDVPHFDNPAQVDKHIQSIGLDAVFYVPGLYMNNFVHYYPPLKGADGVLEFWQPVRPDAAVPAVDIDDTGDIVVYLLNHWDAWRGKHFNAAPRYITFQDIVDSYTHVHGTKTRYVYISQATFKKYTQQGLPPKVQDEVLRMHDLFNQFGYFGGALLAEQPKDRSFEYTTIDKYWQKQGKLSADK